MNLLTFASSQGLDINIRHHIIIFRLFFTKIQQQLDFVLVFLCSLGLVQILFTKNKDSLVNKKYQHSVIQQ